MTTAMNCYSVLGEPQAKAFMPKGAKVWTFALDDDGVHEGHPATIGFFPNLRPQTPDEYLSRQTEGLEYFDQFTISTARVTVYRRLGMESVEDHFVMIVQLGDQFTILNVYALAAIEALRFTPGLFFTKEHLRECFDLTR